ncbi:MAG: carbohydrate porin [Bacteroidota bacterium]|nr:carbohydrate porin [Bacteroidota bacterium]
MMIINSFQYIRIRGLLFFLAITFAISLHAQILSNANDSAQSWNFHIQNTIIKQYHPAISSKYSGENSLNKNSENTLSNTGTIYLGAKLWKGAEGYLNTEISGGSGFSKTTGIAGFPNGEVYRVSDAAPQLNLARLYIRQVFALSQETTFIEDGFNQIAIKRPASYIAISAGKFSVMDFFDFNKYSHDPRTQFYNWALMGNGAWDYPADTKGYTNGLVFELVKPEWALRYGLVMVPTTRNGAVMDTKISQSHSQALEYEHSYTLGSQKGKIRLIGFLTQAQMGNYKKAIEWGIANQTTPTLDAYHAYGRTKYGFGLNIEHALTDNAGLFFRTSWNDGHNETWAFTEIDRHASIGLSLKGTSWNRKDDNLGVAQIINGISKDHRNYLAAGGSGFIIGDGALNYSPECITEIYYSLKVLKYPVWITPDYQFIVNPAYNKDRGPISAFGIRVHYEI